MSQTLLIASWLPNSQWPLDACTWLLMNYINYCKSVEFFRQAKSRVYLLPLSSSFSFPLCQITGFLSPQIAPTVESLMYQNETCKFCVPVCKFTFTKERLEIMADEDYRNVFYPVIRFHHVGHNLCTSPLWWRNTPCLSGQDLWFRFISQLSPHAQ